MAFEGLTQKLQEVFKKLTGRGKLSEADVKLAMREVRMALLEADVNFNVAKDFCASLSQKAVGAEILESLTPGYKAGKGRINRPYGRDKRETGRGQRASYYYHALRFAGRGQNHHVRQIGRPA